MRHTLTKQTERIPFLKILPPLIVGVVLSDNLNISGSWLLSCVAICIGAAVVAKNTRIKDFFVILSLFTLGIASVKIVHPADNIPQNRRLVIKCRITDNVYTGGRWQRSSAVVEAFREYDDSLSAWQGASKGIMIYVDTAHRIEPGDVIGAVAYLNPMDTVDGSSGYARTMRSRGITAKAYVIEGRFLGNYPPPRLSIWGRAVMASKGIQAYLSERLTASTPGNTGESVKGVALALITGDKHLLDRQTRSEYARSGISHILAISGLHLGIIFLLLNYLLSPLVFVRHGNIIRSVSIVVILWGYSFISGMSPSVLRSAFMLTVLQVSMMRESGYESYNALFSSAFVLMMFNPLVIYDISFQMSYLAILSILFFYKRLNRWLGVGSVKRLIKRSAGKYKGFRRYALTLLHSLFSFSAGSIVIALAAQIGVAPITGFVFGLIPFVNLIINPVIMIIVTLAMASGFLYLALCGIPFFDMLGSLFYWLLEVQNDIAAYVSGWRLASLETDNFPFWVLMLCYFIMTVIVLIIKQIEETTSSTRSESLY